MTFREIFKIQILENPRFKEILEIPFKERYHTCEKYAKNQILQKKTKKTRETPQDVFFDFWWFWTDSDGFYRPKHANSWFSVTWR